MIRVVVAVSILAMASCGGGEERPGPGQMSISPVPSNLDEFTLSSPAFADGEPIPEQFSCDGDDVSPPLEWSGVPEGAAELLLTLLDPDAPSGVFTHWTVYAIDPSTTGFPSGVVSSGALEGLNELRAQGYGGPCPPEGETHRYFFTLAVLSEASGLQAGAAPGEVDAALQNATATTTLSGTYPG